MRSFISKLTYKAGILLIALAIVVISSSFIEKQFNISPKLSKLIGDVAGAIFVSGKFLTPTITSAQVTSPYQQVDGIVTITGNVGIGITNPGSKLDVIGDITVGAAGSRDLSSGRLKLNNSYVNSWGNSIIDGRVWSANSNIHLSPPNGNSVIINSDYRDAGGAVGGTAGLIVSGTVTAPTFSGNATTATSLAGTGKTNKESRLWRSDNEDSYHYYIRHYWTGSTNGWRITANNDIGDEQANIHRVSVDQADNADSVDGVHLNQWVNTDSSPTFQGMTANRQIAFEYSNRGVGSYFVFGNGELADGWARLTNWGDYHNGYHNLAVGQIYYNGSGPRADLAEVIPVDQTEKLKIGELVSTDPLASVRLHRTRGKNDSTLVGIVSNLTTAAMVIGGDTQPQDISKIEDKKPIALVGRVITIVNLDGGVISTGDTITSSSIPGTGMKQTRAGEFISKAMESYDGSMVNSTGVQQIINHLKTEIGKQAENDKIDYQLAINDLTSPLPAGSGRIITFVDGGFYDPDLYLANSEQLKIVDNHGNFDVQNNGSIIDKIGAFTQLVVGKIQAGIIETKQLIVNGVNILDRLDSQQKEIDALKAEIENLKK
ncbi:MAG: hypothetical protein PHQ59_00230 [Candidatus Daviesbacteria bacterium]|nr:hypothetical protein [Candidatus Daviesbacteria bacterium]